MTTPRPSGPSLPGCGTGNSSGQPTRFRSASSVSTNPTDDVQPAESEDAWLQLLQPRCGSETETDPRQPHPLRLSGLVVRADREPVAGGAMLAGCE